jgi:hypothetical protein
MEAGTVEQRQAALGVASQHRVMVECAAKATKYGITVE